VKRQSRRRHAPTDSTVGISQTRKEKTSILQKQAHHLYFLCHKSKKSWIQSTEFEAENAKTSQLTKSHYTMPPRSKPHKFHKATSEYPLSEQVSRLEGRVLHLLKIRRIHAKTILNLQTELRSTAAKAETYKKKTQSDLTRKKQILQTITGDYYRVMHRNKRLEADLAESTSILEGAQRLSNQRTKQLDTSRKGTDMVMEELYSLRKMSVNWNKALRDLGETHDTETTTLRSEKEHTEKKLGDAEDTVKQLQQELEMQREESRIHRCSLAVALKLLPKEADRVAYKGLVERVARHYVAHPNGVGNYFEDIAEVSAYLTPSPSTSGQACTDDAKNVEEPEEDIRPNKRRRVTGYGSPVSIKREYR
jgi:uncharacterized membrane-anchored protein YhcB (DUF1043 family)